MPRGFAAAHLTRSKAPPRLRHFAATSPSASYDADDSCCVWSHGTHRSLLSEALETQKRYTSRQADLSLNSEYRDDGDEESRRSSHSSVI